MPIIAKKSMNLSILFLTGWCLIQATILAKRTDRETGKRRHRDPNTIAIFSEDDIAGKLPSPKQVAANIPKKLIFQDTKKTNEVKSFNAKNKNKGKKEMKHRKNHSNEVLSNDRKSKSMNETEDESEFIEYEDQFHIVQPNPSNQISPAPDANQIQVPTATIVTVTEAFPSAMIKIQNQAEATTLKNDDAEYTKIPPLRSKRFVQKGNVKRAESSSHEITVNKILFISLAILLILII